MSIYKQKNSSIYSYDFEYKGERYRGTTGLKTKAKAREYEEKIKREVRENVALGIVKEITFDKAIGNYINNVILPKIKKEEEDLKKNPTKKKRYTNRNALTGLARLEKWFGSNTKLSDVATKQNISSFKNERLTEDEVKLSTIDRDLSNLRAVLNFAFDDGYLAKKPYVKLSNVDHAREYFLTATEEAKLLEKCPDFLRPLIEFYLDTGARKSCAINLMWTDVDFTKDPVVVTFSSPKGNNPYSVPLPERSIMNLKRLHNMRSSDFDNVFTWIPDQDYRNKKGELVLAKDEVTPIGDFKKIWNTSKKEAGLSDIRIHDLRHTYASKLVKKKVSLYEVSKLLGHKSIKQTERYAHLAVDDLSDAVNVLNG